MEFIEGFELINYSFKEKQKELLFFRWVTNYEDKISFEEFEKELVKNTEVIDNSTVDEIMEKVKSILNMER